VRLSAHNAWHSSRGIGYPGSVTDREEAQTALSRVLLEKVRADAHPSATHMSILEETMPPELAREYLNVLLEKVLTDSSPSIDMLRRIQRISGAL
jgi:hypothetical protein